MLFTKSVIILFLICVNSLTVIVCVNAGMEMGSSAVRLELRYDEQTRKYFLDVYNPGSLNMTGPLTNPRCELEDGPIREVAKIVILELFENLTWSEAGSTSAELEYSLTKAVYKVIVEGDGYLRCRAEVNNAEDEVTTDRFLKRYLSNIFSMKLRHECSPTQCNNISHWLTRGVKLTTSLNKSISSSILPVNNIRSFPIRIEPIDDTSVWVIYRVEITMNDPPKIDPDPRSLLSMLDDPLLLVDHPLWSVDGPLWSLDNVKPRRMTPLPPEVKDLELLEMIKNIIHRMESNSTLFSDVFYVRSTKFCHREAREAHINGSTSEINWPTTALGMKSASIELCITKDNTPQVLECAGDFSVGASWSSSEAAFECQVTTERTNKLHKLSKESSFKTEMTPILKTLTTELSSQKIDKGAQSIFSPAEIKYVADVLSNIKPHSLLSTDLSFVANITSSIMQIPDLERKSKVNSVGNLKVAQESSNSSNAILESLDRILLNIKLTNGSKFIVTRKFVTMVVDLSSNVERIVGIAALKNRDPLQAYFRKQDIIPLTPSHDIDMLLDMDIAAAVFIPQELFNYKGRQSHRLVVNLFYDDSLFGSTRTFGRTKHVLSVTLDGKKHRNLNPPLILMFDAEHRRNIHNINTSTNLSGHVSSCVFWNFATNAGEAGWSDSGCTLAKSINQSQTLHKDICVCTHMTHFGELLRESPYDYEEENFHKFSLDLITIFGCLSSLCGLLGIAVTSIVFPEWRRGTSRKVQLSLCAALGLLMLSFLSLTFTRDSPKDGNFFTSYSCMATGIALHYSIIASFCWMVVAAWGQYFRLTRPFESLNRRPHFLLKASLFAWGIPIIPCLTILIMDSEVYGPPNCYPTGKYLYFSVLVPVVVAVSINATIFILILCSIYNCCGLGMQSVHLRNNQCERTVALRKLLTTVFLFMLLGLSWVFGVLNMSYIFCATASLQGLAVFIFFVILEKNTREKWLTFVSQKKDEKFVLHSSSISADFVRRWSHGHQRAHRSATTRISTISD